MLKFPCLAFKENRVVFSKEELEWKIKEMDAVGKACEVGIYGFSAWENADPIQESVILDKVVFIGTEAELTTMANKKLREGIESTLIYDGKIFLLFVREPQESVQDLTTIRGAVCDINLKFTFPGFPNLHTGKLSKIVKMWKL